jgi:serine O-acetyltransferase
MSVSNNVSVQSFASDHVNQVWQALRQQATRIMVREPLLIPLCKTTVLDQPDLPGALAAVLSGKLATEHLPAKALFGIVQAAYQGSRRLQSAAARDLQAAVDRDPATHHAIEPFLHHKGFQALAAWRVAAQLWADGRKPLALVLQNRISELFGVDIHPAASIGEGVFIDHATAVVIGETAVVEDNVSLLHEVTLGGRGLGGGRRHPHVEAWVQIGAGAKILGPIRVGANARVGAGSVVLENVPAEATVVGVPGRVAGGNSVDDGRRLLVGA